MQVPSRILKRKIRILQTELQMLQRYNSEIQLLFKDYSVEFNNDLIFFLDKAKQLNPQSTEDTQEAKDEQLAHDVITLDPTKKEQTWQKAEGEFKEVNDEEELLSQIDNPKSSLPPWARKLFKKIALMTHPDRINDEGLQEQFQRIFLRAAQAFEKGNLDDLIGVAVELNLDAGIEQQALIPRLESKIKKTKEEISEIEKTPEWVWGEALGIINVRVMILEKVLQKKGFSLSKDDITAIILEREKLNASW